MVHQEVQLDLLHNYYTIQRAVLSAVPKEVQGLTMVMFPGLTQDRLVFETLEDCQAFCDRFNELQDAYRAQTGELIPICESKWTQSMRSALNLSAAVTPVMPQLPKKTITQIGAWAY